MNGRKSRNKGATFERWLANVLKRIWPGAKRGIGQTRSAGEVADVEGTDYWVEAKRHKRCNIRAAWRQACEATDGRPVLVVTKDDFAEPLVTMSLDRYLLLEAMNQGAPTVCKTCVMVAEWREAKTWTEGICPGCVASAGVRERSS